jgi:putative oxidoreductase
VLLARLVFGGLMAVHGSQKLFGWFGGAGLSGTGEFFEVLGFRPGRSFALADGIAECAGGLLLVIGLVVPVAGAMIVSVMLVAIVTVHWRNGLLAQTNGIELPVLYIASALALSLTGPGAYSIDSILGTGMRWPTQMTLLALAAGVLGAVAGLGMRRAPTAGVRA